MCSSYLCKKNCVFGHCLKLHVYFELCTLHHFVNVSFVASNWSEVEHGAMSTLLLSLELRNCFPYVRTMPLILANSYQITSLLHMVLSTVTVSVFIEKKNLNRPCPLAPAPFLGCFSQKLWGIGFSQFETFRFGFLYFWHL